MGVKIFPALLVLVIYLSYASLSDFIVLPILLSPGLRDPSRLNHAIERNHTCL
jgi:hypothetical protein